MHPRLPAAPAFLPRFLVALLGFIAAVHHASAFESRFTDSLTPTDQAAIGLGQLTSDQRAALDAQVLKEVTAARQGDVTAFAKTFTQRRSLAQADAAGLAALTDTERAQLDALVARAIAVRPTVTFIPHSRARPDGEVPVVIAPKRAELHGEVTLTYGASSGGGSFYGGSLTTTYRDPKDRFTVSITYAEYHGKGAIYETPLLLDDEFLRR